MSKATYRKRAKPKTGSRVEALHTPEWYAGEVKCLETVVVDGKSVEKMVIAFDDGTAADWPLRPLKHWRFEKAAKVKPQKPRKAAAKKKAKASGNQKA